MRHKKKGRKLGRNSSHRKALSRNILRSLVEFGKIITTLAKAKEYAPQADKLITLAKRAEAKMQEMAKKLADAGEVDEQQVEKQSNAVRAAYFRKAMVILGDKKLVQKLFYEIAPLYSDRNGGYTQVLRLSKRRIGDNAPQAVLKLVEDLPDAPKEDKKTEKERLKKEKQEKKRKEKERKAKEKEKAKK